MTDSTTTDRPTRAEAEAAGIAEWTAAAEAERDAAQKEVERWKRMSFEDARQRHRQAIEFTLAQRGLRLGELQWKWRTEPPKKYDYWESELAILDALNSQGIPAWSGDASGCAAQIVQAQAQRADVAEAKFSVLTDSVVQETARRESAESRLADLARLAEAYRQVQREAVAHHRRCAKCQGGQACDEAGSILDEMAKRRAPFWRELDRALETTGGTETSPKPARQSPMA